MPDDHSELVPLLPIPNRTVKQLRADDSAGSRVKVGHRQALTALKTPSRQLAGVLSLGGGNVALPTRTIAAVTREPSAPLAIRLHPVGTQASPAHGRQITGAFHPPSGA